jgi:outer membrane receptor protein involved in Fe transport
MRLPKPILLSGALLCNAVRADEVTPTDAAPIQLDPLRVTADLWETPLDRIAASVSVYGPETLDAGSVRHFGDLVDQIPNLTWTGGTSRPRYFLIRGVGENSQFEGETPDSSVRFLVDDLDFTGLGMVGSTFDVRQVEVLRGPQAGAFGANAAGGVVRLVTNEPTPYATGTVEGTAGTDGLREAGVAIGGPLLPGAPETLMFRLAINGHVSDGFRRNTLLDADTNARDERAARLKLIWNPGASWRWNATVLLADADNGYDEFALDNNGRFTFSNEPGRDRQESRAGSLRGVYSGWQDVRFTTVTSVTGTDSIYGYDADWTIGYANDPDGPVGAEPATYDDWFSDLRRDRRAYSQEFRLDSESEQDALGWIDRWTLGVYGSAIKEKGRYTDPFTNMPTRYEGENAAIFGQVGHDFGAADRLTVGLRGEWVASDSDFAPRFDDTLWGGKVAWEHDFTATQSGFASVTRGYKAGGVAVDARLGANDPRTYATETLWNYELGLRSRFFDKQVANRLTAFWISRRDTQVRDSAGFGGNFYFYTDNGDDAEIFGLEDEATWNLPGFWSVTASLALMNSDLDRFALSNGVNTGGGRELANVPAYGYSLAVRRAPTRGVFGSVELVARDHYYESNTHAEQRRAYQVVNASLGHAWGDWSLTFWGRNLLDAEYDKRVFYFGNDATTGYAPTRYVSRADPRQFGVSAAYRF